MPNNLDRLIYIDDSRHPAAGLVIYGWVEFRPDRWEAVLKSWLDMRKRLWREYAIAVTEELHTTQYVNGRGRISKAVPDRHVHDGIEYWKDFGREVAAECLDTLRSTEGLTVGAVWRRGAPGDIATTRRRAYADLVARFEDELQVTNSLALLFMDGDGSDTSYRSTHRSLRLSERRVIEDAIHLDSKTSQLTQMADLVAWSANAHVDRVSGNEFAWGWYENYLSERDPARRPQQI